MDQVGFGDSSGWFVDPLKKLAGALGALEIESAWVIDRVGGGQYQGLVAQTTETGWVYFLVAGVGLFGNALQVGAHFTGSAGHITLGEESGRRALVILPGTTVGGLHTPELHGRPTTRGGVMFFQLVQELIGVKLLQHLHFGEFPFVVHFWWHFYEVVFPELVESY